MTDGPKWTDVAIVVLTIGIVFFALMQWLEMRGSGRQTDQLVSYARAQADAANDQADAAQQFSDTAEDINSRMSEAVDQLEAAADNTKRSVQATQDAMRLDQRAWLATARINSSQKLEVNSARDFGVLVVFRNTGKTPAKKSVMLTFWDWVPKNTKPPFAAREVPGQVPSISKVLVAPNAEYYKEGRPFREFIDGINSSTLTPEQKETTKKTFVDQFTTAIWCCRFTGEPIMRMFSGVVTGRHFVPTWSLTLIKQLAQLYVPSTTKLTKIAAERQRRP